MLKADTRGTIFCSTGLDAHALQVVAPVPMSTAPASLARETV